MKKLFVLLLLVFTTVCYSQTNYVRGFDNGYKEGYCHDKGIGCIEPIPPIAPIPKIGESSESYNDGYNRGFEMGLQSNNNSSQTQQSGSSYIVHDYGEPQSMFDADLAIMALAAKQRQHNQKQQRMERLFAKMEQAFEDNNSKLNSLNNKEKAKEIYKIVGKKWEKYIDRNFSAFNYSNVNLIVNHIYRMYDDATEEVNKKYRTQENSGVKYYNLGVISAKKGNDEEAIEYYKKAIRLDPKMETAYINLAATILEKEIEIVKQMNKALANRNNTKYDELGDERKNLYKQALPYLEKVMKINPENKDVLRTAMNIYYVLGKKTQADEIKVKLNGGEENVSVENYSENPKPNIGYNGGYTSDKITEYKWNPTTKKYEVEKVLNIESKLYFTDKYYAFKRGDNPWKGSPWTYLTYEKETGRNFFYDSYGQNLALQRINRTVTWYMNRENGVWTKAIVYENLTPNPTIKPK